MGGASWKPLAVLAAAQFLMVLDQAVMNVSISQLVADFHTSVTTIQAVIAFYSLVMAALMVAGGKLGDIWGRRRAFRLGHAIYGIGSLLTALAWSVPALMIGWSKMMASSFISAMLRSRWVFSMTFAASAISIEAAR